MSDSKRPKLLCMMQLPPPLHGASVMNQRVADSATLAARFQLEVLPLSFANSIADIGTVRVAKLITAVNVAGRLVSRLLRDRPDVVYFTISPFGGAFYRDCVYVGILKALRVPRVFHLHGKGIASETTGRWRRAIYRWAFRGARVIQQSSLLAAEVAAVCEREALEFVPNAVPDDAQALPDRSGHTGPARILYLSNLIEEKGPLVALAALATLQERGIAFEATFVGAPSDPKTLERLQRGIEQHGLSQHVRYVGPAYGAEKNELLRSHDIFVFPTFYRNETFSLVLLEAMQFGLPVISTSEGAIADIVEDGSVGFLVPSRDPETLADRISHLATDPAARLRMGEHARARFLERFTLERFEQQLCNVLSKAFEPQPR